MEHMVDGVSSCLSGLLINQQSSPAGQRLSRNSRTVRYIRSNEWFVTPLSTRAGVPGASSAEEEPSAEAEEEDLQRALEAIDTGLVTFSNDLGAPVRARGAVPYYRLHNVVAAAVTRKAFILVSENGSLYS